MIAYDTLVGEFRVHYAGFFDPGFGHSDAGGEGSRAVLEVRSYEVPFVLEHGQLVGRLHYERLTALPRAVRPQLQSRTRARASSCRSTFGWRAGRPSSPEDGGPASRATRRRGQPSAQRAD